MFLIHHQLTERIILSIRPYINPSRRIVHILRLVGARIRGSGQRKVIFLNDFFWDFFCSIL